MKAFALRTATACLLLVMLAGHFVAPVPAGAASIAPTLNQMSDEIAAIVDKAGPAVVQIVATVKPKAAVQIDPRLEQLLPYLNPQLREQLDPENLPPRHGLGSGCVIDASGIILTNSHVVKDADELKVILSGDHKDKEYKAEVIGTDPDSDVAVIKIDAKNLPVLELGDSEKIKVGHLVLAIGNPQGLSESVSFGIVSAKNRSEVRITEFANFIQTDAAINQGNSGGPLLDMEGRLIGINTWIFSTTGGSQGLGFAIPINQALRAAEQLRSKGHVARGWLGVMLQELTPEFGEHFGTGELKGAVVSQSFEDAPANGVLQPNDAIVELNGQPLKSMMDFRNRVANMPPNETISMLIYRGGKKMNVKVKLGERPSADEIAQGRTSGKKGAEKETVEEEDKSEEIAKMGFSVKPLPAEMAERMSMTDVKGLLVTEVDPNSEAYEQGLRRGSVITQINQRDVSDLEGLRKALKAGKDMKSVMLMIRERQGSRLLIVPKE